MDANARQAVLNTVIDYFHDKVMSRNFPPTDDTALLNALRGEVNSFFSETESRLHRLEHPMEDKDSRGW